VTLIAVETNVLVYAHRREAAEHDAARKLLFDLASGPAVWAIPWPCAYEFLSVVTNRRIWKDAASTSCQSWSQLEAWMGSPHVKMLAETADGYPEILEGFVCRPRVVGPVVHDARVAAICVAHGVDALLTRDRDFGLFPELPVSNPFD
jgi:toxin-antitoxin system PIN domain toxin